MLFLGFAFFSCIYKMVGSEYSMENYQSSKLSIGTAMKNPKMLNVFPDSLRNKKEMCNNTQQMCDQASFENGGTLTFYLAGDAGALEIQYSTFNSAVIF